MNILRRAFAAIDMYCRDNWAVAAWLVLASLVFFRLFFDFGILDPTNVGWLLRGGDDLGTDILGWHALRNAPWSFPPGNSPLLGWPAGTTILYSDSNPLLSLLLKPLAPILPADFQLIGWWYLISIFLDLWFGWLLLRRHAPGAATALLGALAFGLMPAFYDGLDHVTLCSHWTILWAFWNVVECPSTRRTGMFAVLLAITAMLHPYLLAMVGGIWAFDWAYTLWNRRGDGLVAILRSIRAAGVVLACTVAGIWLAGFQLGSGAQTESYGWLVAGVDAFINPMRPDYSRLLPSRAVTDGQMLEGFHYLGFGFLLLVAIMLVLAVRNRARVIDLTRGSKAAVPLVAACVAMAFFAISHEIHLHERVLLTLPMPDSIIGLLGVFRASGRFMWPLSYLLLLSALRILFVLGPVRTPALIGCLLAVQLIDITPMAEKLRRRTDEARDHRTYALTPDPAWNSMIKHAEAVVFWPDMWSDMPRYYEIAWRTLGHRKPVAPAYLARPPLHSQRVFESDGARQFAQGWTDPRRLTVVLDACQVPAALAAKARILDGARVFPPAGFTAELPVAAPAPVLEWGRIYQLGEGAARCLRPPDTWEEGERFVVSAGRDASLLLRFAQAPGSYRVELLARSVSPNQRVDVLINGSPVNNLLLSRALAVHVVNVPAMVSDHRMIQTLEFIVANAPSPAQPMKPGESWDARMEVHKLRMTPDTKIPDRPVSRPGG